MMKFSDNRWFVDPATIEICGDAQLLSALIKACEIFESFVYE